MPNPNELARMEEELKGERVMGDINAQAIAVLERMLEQLHATSERMIASFRKRIQDLELENQRYREALTYYADMDEWLDTSDVWDVWTVAQEALKEVNNEAVE